MNQHPRLPAARTGRYHDATRFLVRDDFHLTLRQLPEKLLILHRSQIPLNLVRPLPFEIFDNKLLVIHLEIIPDILQCRPVILYHQIGIFAHDMHLLDFLLVELVQHPIVFLLVPQPVILQAPYLHGIVQDQETTLQLDCANLGQVQESLFHIPYLRFAKLAEKRGGIRLLHLRKEFQHRELDEVSIRCILLLVHLSIKPAYGKTRDFRPSFKTSQGRNSIHLATDFHVMERILLFPDITLDHQEVQQRPKILFGGEIQSFPQSILVQLLARDPQESLRNPAQDVAFHPDKTIKDLPRFPFRHAGIQQVGGNILGIGQYAFLPHPLHYRHDLEPAQAQHVG